VHIPDGFINAPASLAAGAAAAGGVGVSLRRAAQTLQDRQAPLAGLVAAYIFAVQMLNFPVAAGTSGHLLGGAMAAILVGPWAGALCVAVVLLVQGLLFADGGLSALGLNIVNMSLVTAWGGYAVFALLRRALPATKASVTAAAGVGAGISVVLASLAFVVEYAVGGNGGAPVGTVLAAMVGVHTLIGIGEGVITALTVGLVLGVRPDLVHGAAELQTPLVLGPKGGTAEEVR
jgi:cobalt/nickel transport system permease protein